MIVAELYRVAIFESTHIIELHLPEMLDPSEFDQLNEGMLAHFDGKAQQAWIMDLSATTYMGSAMLGLMVNIRQRVKSAGGRLVLCGLSRQLNDIFVTSSMQRLFTITRTRPEAIKALAR